jgi:hypothetical protein
MEHEGPGCVFVVWAIYLQPDQNNAPAQTLRRPLFEHLDALLKLGNPRIALCE